MPFALSELACRKKSGSYDSRNISKILYPCESRTRGSGLCLAHLSSGPLFKVLSSSPDFFVILDEAVRKSGILFTLSISLAGVQMPAHSRTLVTSSVICGYASLDRTYGPHGRVSRGLEKRAFRDQAARSGARVVGRTGGPVLGFRDRHLDSSTFGCDDRAVWW